MRSPQAKRVALVALPALLIAGQLGLVSISRAAPAPPPPTQQAGSCPGERMEANPRARSLLSWPRMAAR